MDTTINHCNINHCNIIPSGIIIVKNHPFDLSKIGINEIDTFENVTVSHRSGGNINITCDVEDHIILESCHCNNVTCTRISKYPPSQLIHLPFTIKHIEQYSLDIDGELYDCAALMYMCPTVIDGFNIQFVDNTLTVSGIASRVHLVNLVAKK